MPVRPGDRRIAPDPGRSGDEELDWLTRAQAFGRFCRQIFPPRAPVAALVAGPRWRPALPC
jgi:hypothetical protein